MSIDFQARQLMMGTESSSVNLTFLWKSDQSGKVKVCGAENELQDEDSTTDNSIGDTQGAKEQNSPDIKEICPLVKTEANSKNGLRILAAVTAFRDVFALHDSKLGRTHLVEHDIDTGESGPIKLAPYRLAPGKMSVVKSEIEDMLTRVIIRPSNSPYSAPIVLVTKKDGNNRMCVDFRKLNDVTRKDPFPLPQIDQILDHLHGAKVFSSLDLASGYWQVPLSEAAIPKPAFVTPDGGHFEFLRLPFGLCNAPGTFQRLMNAIFREYLYNFVLIFLDDVLVFSNSMDGHEEHLQLVFEALRAANLKLKPKKCKLYQESVTYLGYKLSADGISSDEGKIRALRESKREVNITEVRSTVGYCSYYRWFVKEFAGIARPLHEITKKNRRFSWTPDCQKAFEKLKAAMMESTILVHPDYQSPFVLDTDASDNSLGAVLSNVIKGVEHPVAFAGRVLTSAESKYSTTKREALAVIQDMKWFKPYLWCTKFVLRTDHASLQWLF